jgi:hypothetical protein
MKRHAGGEALVAVQNYVHYLQLLGVTALPVTLTPPVRAQAAPPEATPAIRLAQLAAAVHDCR